MKKTKLGATGPEVFPVALGCMGMSGAYGKTTEADGVAAIQEAIDRGIDLIDTGDFYDSGANELIVRRGIEGHRDKIKLSVKYGAMRGPDGSWGGIDTRPAATKNFLAYSLKRLGVDYIDVYRPSRLDPNVPIEETIGAIAEMVQKGYVRHIGLSEVGADTIRRAAKVHPIVDLQIEYSPVSRKPEEKVFPALEELGISATLYSVLGRGLLSGSKAGGPGDFRAFMPRFSADNRAQNEAVADTIAAFAKKLGMSSAQLLIAWALFRQPRLVPVIGAKTPAQLGAIFAAVDRPLTAGEANELEALVPPDAVAGPRYAAQAMAHLDSEK